MAGILASSFFAFAIGYSTAWCMRIATTTSYSMVGALNKLPIAFSGMLFFQKERDSINIGSIVSILLGFLSGILYTWAQIRERRNEVEKINFSKFNNNLRSSDQGEPLTIEIREQK